MKRFIFILILLIGSIMTKASAQNIDIMFFYSDACPHCHEEDLFLKTLEVKYPEINIKRYEVSKSQNNLNLFEQTAQKLGQKATSVPFLVINDEAVIGYQSDETTGKKIVSVLENLLDTGKTTMLPANGIKIPLINKVVSIETLSLPVLTIFIGTLDGFNPCAMWVLLFLISMLLGMKNRRRMWLFGTTFILTSALIYFLFLGAWLNIFLFLGYITIIRVIIGVAALGIGIHYLNEYKKYKTGCEVTNSEDRQKIFAKIRDIISKNNIFLALIGIILLAIAVNFVELLCSAGLPAVYTQILASSSLPTWQYYAYLLLYVFFFMLDDIIIFTIAMVTLEATGISSKYTHVSHLIGGILMAIIGILMLLRPDILMMN